MPGISDFRFQISDLEKRDAKRAVELRAMEKEWNAWPRNPIDDFVLARLAQEGLAPSPEADPYTLCRRVYLDLIGLPPTPEEADAFCAGCERRIVTSVWSIACSPRRITASAGRGAGSISPATPTPTATRRIATGASGRIATG